MNDRFSPLFMKDLIQFALNALKSSSTLKVGIRRVIVHEYQNA